MKRGLIVVFLIMLIIFVVGCDSSKEISKEEFKLKEDIHYEVINVSLIDKENKIVNIKIKDDEGNEQDLDVLYGASNILEKAHYYILPKTLIETSNEKIIGLAESIIGRLRTTKIVEDEIKKLTN